MQLKVFLNDEDFTIYVPISMIEDAHDYFEMIDRDMDRGYQMSRQWVENPDPVQRCQIAGDRILTALETNNEKTGTLMAAYILSRVPNAYALHLNDEGDMNQYELEMR